MLKSEYRKEIIDVIKDIVFLNSYDENLVGICLYGYCDPDNDLDLICFYNDLDKKSHKTYSNSYCIGDTYIKSVYLDFNRHNAFIGEIFNGVIIYDPASTLSKILNREILKNHGYCVGSNEIDFDLEFTKELIDSIILNSCKTKNNIEKYNSIVNIYKNVVACKTELEEEDYDLFVGTMNSYNKIFMDKKDAKIHNKALTEVINSLKENQTLTKKK